MQRKIIISEGEFYHLYNRGVEKRKIFLDRNDHERFLKLLYVANGDRAFVYRDIEKRQLAEIDRGKPLVAIGAYTLMPNHFHLLIREIREGGTSAFMEKLLTGYAGYFNKRHTRVGALFQGTYKAQHANRDEYLKYLYAYIHLNPLKMMDPMWKTRLSTDRRKCKAFLNEYYYSSYQDYVGDRDRAEKAILARQNFPEYFLEQKEFGDYLDDWIEFRDEVESTQLT